jgi:sigma54-dependent transcription regulator
VDHFAVHLFDLRSFSRLGILRPPVLSQIRGLAFSADGSRLAAVGTEARVAVWNLHRLQDRLAAFGLAWDSAPARTSAR